MKHYDSIVVGSGIAGLTLARVLSQHGKKILLLEKASILGGSLARFRVEESPSTSDSISPADSTMTAPESST